MSQLPDLKSSMLFSSIIEPLSACGHECAGPHASTKTALSGWHPGLALDLRTQSKPNKLWVAECYHPMVHCWAGWATRSSCSKHGLQIRYSPLFNFWQPNTHNLISARTDNPERVGSEFCIYCSCLLENKENAVTLVLFLAFRSICSLRDMRCCTKCCWGALVPLSKGRIPLHLCFALSISEALWIASWLSRSKVLLIEYGLRKAAYFKKIYIFHAMCMTKCDLNVFWILRKVVPEEVP